MAAKAAATVLKRSHSIKHAAQAKRKSVLRSLSHTSSPPPSNNHEDQYELEHLKIKYESFCNREDEEDEENEADRDADVEDDEDEADENESLLHRGLASSSSCPPVKDINNNMGLMNMSDNSGGGADLNVEDPSALKVIIVNNSSVALVPNEAVKSKRIDSIRMRHHSSLGPSIINANNHDAVSSSSSSSRLKKYFKCRKDKVRSKASQRRHSYLVIFLLFVVNLLNYIDRYTLAGTNYYY